MSTTSASNPYGHLEEWLNRLTHGVAALASLAGMVVLIVMASLHADPWKIVSVSIYGVCMTLLFAASTLYHSARSPRLRAIFKMLDHCSIYLLIAGTYTPFLLVNMRGATGWTMFGIVWGLAALGITLKLVYGHRLKALQITIYLAMGWLVIAASGKLLDSINEVGFWLLLAGGIVYTLGVVFYLIRRIPLNHAIWHLFVMGGSLCHFLAIYFGVIQPGLTG